MPLHILVLCPHPDAAICSIEAFILFSFQNNRIPVDLIEQYTNDPFFNSSFDQRLPLPSFSQEIVTEALTPASWVYLEIFAWSKPPSSYSTGKVFYKLNHAVNEDSLLDLAPDGGLANSCGTFGLVLAISNYELWEIGRGSCGWWPVDFQFQTVRASGIHRMFVGTFTHVHETTLATASKPTSYANVDW